MQKQKKPASTSTTTSLRRSPRLYPQTPATLNLESPTIHQAYSQKPTKPAQKILVCGVTSIGLKKSPRLTNVLTASKYSERCGLISNLDYGLRRSARFKKGVNEGFSVRRSPRIVLKENNGKIVENCVNIKRGGSMESGSDKGVCLSDERDENDAEKSERGNGSGVLVLRREGELERNVSGDSLDYKSTLLDVAKDEEVRVGRKRKREEEEDEGSFRGWSKEQEMALQRAYFVAKPTPNFWKKVSKLVPGKSAQDCFDKIHSDHITPLHPLPGSRARRMNQSPIGSLSLSASKLLNSSGIKAKRPISKQTSRLVHKTVRQLVQKCNRVEKDYEADLFSALEPTVNPSMQDSQVNSVLSTPKPLQEKQKCLQKYDDKDSDLKKRLSKRSSRRINLVSPPVLKQVKNRALHEKYIDHLHTREAKRNAAARRAGRLLGGKENLEQTNVQNVDMVQSAKDALISDARDGVKQLEHLQAIARETSSDFDDDCIDSMEDEAECGI